MSGRERALLRRTAVRLGLQAAATVAVIVALLAGVATLVVVRAQHAAADQLLTSALTRAEDVADPPNGVWVVIDTPGGRSATPGLPPGLPDLPAQAALTAAGRGFDDLHVGGVEYRVLTERDGTTVRQAALDLSTDHTERRTLLDALLLCGVLALILAAAGGAWLGHRAVQPLATAAALQRRFVADAGHELRTPLTLLHTRAQLLRRRMRTGADLDPRADADLDALVDDSSRLADILDDLLVAADPRGDTPTRLLDLREPVLRACEAARADAREAVVIEHRSPNQVVPVRGTAGGLHRALASLIDNAVRHARSRVLVTTGTDGRDAIVEVSDDGPGIDPTMTERIFDRFASSGEARERRYGLGLALVAEIADRHGGSVGAANLGDGATLTLRIPLAKPVP
ncbi:MAG: HAMP domain-containing histidine kinase [Hamadaea sp.]|uniref:sensor histidine kinase n=1 Tax=Hamadaea sp. TaxID=2024425 RepID=UPI0017ACAE44|nr:HAMP domain-containing sensor histidine kinase [Hamadaea sp.]NUT18875.1 HAMP domain-containing histidine kinase [Hamadaea sp.]